MLKAYDTSGNILFQEKQSFPSWIKVFIVAIVLFTIAVTLVAGITAPPGKGRELWFALAVVIPIDLLLLAIFYKATLEKVVTSNGIYFKWSPWQKKFRVIEKESIKTFEVRNNPALHYGIGWFPGYGWMHTATLGKGMQLYLEDGRKFFFSTANKEQFAAALQNLTSTNPKSNLREF